MEYTEIVVSQARPGGVGWSKKDCGLYTLGRAHLCHLRTVPTIVIAHTFCASPDTRISYRHCLLIQGSFCAV